MQWAKELASHFQDTRLMIEHVEKYWCPTITSTGLLGGKEFHFAGDQASTAAK